MHNVRAHGSYIAGTNGTSNGLVPMLRGYNSAARYVDQGGNKRPGAVACYLEPWHADGVPLFPGCNDLPAHALNCFAPLVNVSRRMGPTEFVPASHKPGPVARALEAALQRGRAPADVFSPELSVGDVLVYDQRTVHRGVPNRTKDERPILYLLFARPWFRDHINFGETSLFERHLAAGKKKKKRRRVPE